MMMIILLVDMKEPYLQKTDILLNSKGRITGVESMVTKVASEDQMRLLIVLNSYSEIGFYYYLVAYVHTVYIHVN